VFEPIMRSAAMKEVDRVLRAVAPKEVVLTLIGESGVGKEVLARRAHELSSRRAGPFVPINCAAIPDALFESELFGHERGAFTGATERSRGKIEAAETGTLFLDEIGEMPLLMQAKLLRFLENRRYMRVGGSTKLQADVRLICATLRPLEREVQEGRFRMDLFYRIQGITLVVPPLRERRADIPVLVTRFLAQLSGFHRVVPPKISREVRDALLRHDWPGNVRELRNVLEGLCLLFPGRRVLRKDLPEQVKRQGPPEAPGRRSEVSVRLDLGLARAIEQIIAAVLAEEGGDKVRAAERLGISVRTLQRQAREGRI
jgi:transcriptional regulator with PAS, ATPase and Fis domain